jgi:hypothetical protein
MSFSAVAEVTTIVTFPVNYFLENLAVRSDNSLLVTVLNHKELWFIPAAPQETPEPIRLCTFDQPAMGIVEVEPDVFVICTSNLWGNHESYLHRLDLRGWQPGRPVAVAKILELQEPVRGLNGSCLMGPGVILVADSFAGLIWRVDLAPGASSAKAQVWLKHSSMTSNPNGPMPDQPGINGLAFAPRTHFLYFTSTAQQLLMRVPVEPHTLEAIGEPEFIADGMMGDDLCIDEEADVAYVATHRQNSIDRVPLQPGQRGGQRNSVAGVPFTEELLGPTSGRWGRLPLQVGRVAFFLTDGGIKGPMPDGSLREARVLRVSF